MKKSLDNFLFSSQTNQKALIAKIEELCDGLIYISETDAEIVPFAGEKTKAVTVDELLRQIETTPKAAAIEINFDDFFARLIKIQDWFGEREKVHAGKFIDLKKLLQENLSDLRVFKVGRIRLDIYIVGLDREGRLTGIKTRAVET